MESLKVYQAMAKAIAEGGFGPLFGLVGDANLYMVDSFTREYGGHYVSAANEAGAVLMALGYAAVSGQVGLATVTHGPAVTNTITAMIEGVRSFTPIVLLCGATDPNVESIQDAPQRELMVAAGAGFEEIRSPETAVADFARAVRRARAERRPVALNIPTHLQHVVVAQSQSKPFAPLAMTEIAPVGDDFDNALGIIAAAKRPIVLAGRGAIDENSRAALLRLASRLEAPVATTLRATGLFAGEPFDLGIFGTLSAPAAVEAIMKSDCIIAFSASLNKFTTSNGTFVKGKRVIQVGVSADDLGRRHMPDIGLVGTAPRTVDAIIEALDAAEIPPSGFTSELVAGSLARQPAMEIGSPAEGTVHFATALARLNEILPAERVVTVDAGRMMSRAVQYIGVQSPRRFVHTCNFGSIGLGMGYAIGSSFAEPDRTAVLFAGDGGFMLGGLAEFNSAVRAGVRLVVVVCNDGSYGAEHIQLRRKQMDPTISMFNWPDFAPVADALGGRGITVRKLEDLDRVPLTIEAGAPLLIDLKLDPDCIAAL